MSDKSYHYNYILLDSFLTQDYDPQSVACQLDETMSELVEFGSTDQTYSGILPQRHFFLRSLRNVFLKMEKVQP
jgi:hypothetical protein